MQRIDTATVSSGLFGLGKDGFTDGNPGTGVPATQLNAAWFNNLQEEVAHVIEDAGLTLNGSDKTQLLQALVSKFGNQRIRLSANTTFYVSPSGNDTSGNGTVGSPWLTPQKALDTIQQKYDLNGFTVTIQHADGTYSAGASLFGTVVGAKGPDSILLNGNAGTPANVVLGGIGAGQGAGLTVQNMKLQGTNYCLSASSGGHINAGAGIVYGPTTVAHISAWDGGRVFLNGNYSIVGGASCHMRVYTGEVSNAATITVTLTGTPTFGSFASVTTLGVINLGSAVTYSGAATGQRYYADANAIINTAGGGASKFPGSTAGSTATGGQYI